MMLIAIRIEAKPMEWLFDKQNDTPRQAKDAEEPQTHFEVESDTEFLELATVMICRPSTGASTW